MGRLVGPRQFLINRHPKDFKEKMAKIHMNPSWVRSERFDAFGTTKLTRKLKVSDAFLAEHDIEYLEALDADDEDADDEGDDEIVNEGGDGIVNGGGDGMEQ